jgi:filamentous hemagglutinin family protein
MQADAAELPVACISGSCGVNGPQSWITSGSATGTVVGNTFTINQTSDRAILNWASFNVSADGRVVFQQPKSSSIALNRIFQNSPSRIFGQVDANGQIYLVNPNGVIFGRTAVINASGILASTLSIAPETFDVGIASNTVLTSNNPAALNVDAAHAAGYVVDQDGLPIRGTLDADGRIVANPSGDPIKVQLTVQEGAQLSTNGPNGRILLAGQIVDNSGKLVAADGQVVLAAGQKVYLQGDSDPALRGLLVEVDSGGDVFNRQSGQIETARGNTTLVGLAVNQQGRISATTSVAANGSIRLLARDSVATTQLPELHATHTGTLEFGSGSVTQVLPELADTAKAADEQKQYASRIEAMGHQVTIRENAQLVAKGGEIDISARRDPTVIAPDTIPGATDMDSRLRVAAGAVLDVSGSDAELPMSRNLVQVELRASELADSPNQRNSAIRGQAVTVDARVGTRLGDVSGALATIDKSVAERTSAGGTISLRSDGDVVVASGSTFDVSGGVTHYTGGFVQTTQLIGADGKLYDIGTADPARTYVAIINPTYRRTDDRWGQIDRYLSPNMGRMEPGYDSGSSAGTLQFAGRSMVLNGNFVGNVTAGTYQRSNQPLGGRLLIGLEQPLGLSTALDYGAPSIELVSQAAPIAVGDQASLPDGVTLKLPTDYLRNGFTRTELYSNGEILLPEDSPLRLAPGSSFVAQGQHVEVQADIDAHGGSIALTARNGTYGTLLPQQGITVGDNVTIDVSGTWTNDALVDQAVRPVDALWYDGGSISLSMVSSGRSPQEMILGDRVSLLADGGAQVQRDASVVAGHGGSIAISTGGYQSSITVGADVGLSAFGVLGAAGGKFTLDVPKASIGNGSQWASAQAYDGTPPPVDPDAAPTDVPDADAYFRIGTALFTDYGFSSVSISASSARTEDQPDILYVLPDTQLTAVVKSKRLEDAALLSRASGGTVAGFSSLIVPDAIDRTPATISLAARMVSPNATQSAFNDTAGDLRIGQGAILQADPQSRFSLSSLGSLFIDGSIVARGGAVTIGLGTPNATQDAGYLEQQRVQIGSSAVIDVSGTTLYRPNDLGLLTGKSVSAGTIDLVSARGSIVAEAGSLLDMSGGSSVFDIATGVKERPYERQAIGGAGGSLTVRAPESIGLYGRVDGHAGAGDTGKPASGSLTVQLTREAEWNVPSNKVGTFPTNPRTIELTLHDAPANAGIGSGSARFSQDFIARSGIDSLTVQADGQIDVASGVQLSLGRQLTLDTSLLSISGGGQVAFNAPSVAIGNSLPIDSAATSMPGSGQLQVQADFIELFGSTVWSSIARATVNSTADIRLRGSVRENGSSLGGLSIQGDLSLGAARIYGSTATQFALHAFDSDPEGTAGRIEIHQTGISAGTPLSAGSSISIVARDIVQGGTLLAPFGSISLQGTDSVVLADNSLTSVSGAGSLIPYGNVAIGKWYYSANGNIATATPVDGLPEREISVVGDETTIAPSAVVDVRGGGDLYAYEWQPGTGGTKDALAGGVTPGLYAILPSLAGQVAPYDPQEYDRSGLQPGDSIYLSGFGNLPAGVYALLPARYALLPGAYLVSAVAGSTNLQPGAGGILKDGTPIVTGYRTYGNTGLGGGVFSGFALRPGSYGRVLAAYSDYYASNFFTDAAAKTDSTARVNIPADAGAVSLIAGSRLDALGSVLTAPAAGGEGASIDISAQRLAVIAGTGNEVAVPGEVQVAASRLASWNPSRLLLGGTRVRNADDTIDVTADAVSIRSGADLTLDQIVIAARDRIEVDSGARIASRSATGTAPRLQEDPITLRMSADDAGSAVLAVSDFAQIVPDRATAPLHSASIDIAANAMLASRGSVTIDAPAGGTISGQLTVSGARVSLGADKLIFGSGSQVGATVIDAALEAQLGQSGALRLFASSSIDIARDVAIDLSGNASSEIQLQTPHLSASLPGASARFAADLVSLGSDTATESTQPLAVGTGTLALNANTIELRAGSMDIGGFSQSEWVARTQLIGRGTSHYRLNGDLGVTTPVFALATGANTGMTLLNGSARLQASAPVNAAAPLELGGSLFLLADSIDSATQIAAASGLVTLQARKDLQLRDGALIDVSGRTVAAGGRDVGSQGGTIRLISGTDLVASAGSKLDMSGAGDSSAGRLIVDASGTASLESTLAAHALEGSLGGSFDLYAQQLLSTDSLFAQLQSGGFTQAQRIRSATGDLIVGANRNLAAETVELVADAGKVQIDGTISAIEGDQRGVLRLFGAQGVSLSAGAALHADAAAGGKRGGDIDIGSSLGTIDLAPGSTISANGATTDGVLTLHARVVGSDVGIDRLAATMTDVRDVVIAPKFSTDLATGFASATDFLTPLTAARTWFDSFGATVLARLNPASSPSMTIRPEIELTHGVDPVTHNGDLFLDLSSSPLELSDASWRFNGQPASISVRNSGSLTVSGTISDGFQVIGSGNNRRLELRPGGSSSISLVAGADLASPDSLATLRGAAADLNLVAGTIVRTGTGTVSLQASRDVIFGQGTSVYTGGIAGSPSQVLQVNTNRTYLATFPDQGGSIHIDAGRDVVGSPVAQSASAWQMNGSRNTTSLPFPRFNAIVANNFGWNVGTLGGGDLTIDAARDVVNLSATTANSQRFISTDGTVSSFGGGSLSVYSGNDIDSSMFYGAQGTMVLHADGALGSSRVTTQNAPLYTLVALGDTRTLIEARRDIALERVVNPSIFVTANVHPQRQAYLWTYGDASVLRLQSAGGDVHPFAGTESGLSEFFEDAVRAGVNDTTVFSIYPSSLVARAFAGDIDLSGAITLFPSDNGQLDLFAANDIVASNVNGGVSMSDGKASGVPTIHTLPALTQTVAMSEVLKHGSSGRHIADEQPVLVTAGRDIVDANFYVPKFARFTAGRDISNTSVFGQNLRPNDLTLVSAGRDITFPLNPLRRDLSIGGPGQFDILAGRNVDLGFTSGVTTTGRLLNPGLSTEEGADITVMAGLGRQPDYVGFIDAIVAGNRAFDDQVVAYIEKLTGSKLPYAQALSRLRGLDADRQRPLVDAIFFGELVASGREANNVPGAGFARGYAAINALFTGSAAGVEPAAATPYRGDLSLAFSRIYTLAGGDISLLIPGGLLNVGLASPPPQVQARPPSELGIVAQSSGSVNIFASGDVLVNSSRIFTLLGGDIAAWSTRGNIDAGRGAKSSLSAPPPTVTFDEATGRVSLDFSGAVAGSGIRTIATGDTVQAGNVDLIAPSGFVDSGDAGIVAGGNLNIAAQQVIGVGNIQASGSVTGVPAETSGLGASLAGVSAVASSSTSAATASIEQNTASEQPASLADTALSWLEVFVVGLGDDGSGGDKSEKKN